jgi:hypothetical protein
MKGYIRTTLKGKSALDEKACNHQYTLHEALLYLVLFPVLGMVIKQAPICSTSNQEGRLSAMNLARNNTLQSTTQIFIQSLKPMTESHSL